MKQLMHHHYHPYFLGKVVIVNEQWRSHFLLKRNHSGRTKTPPQRARRNPQAEIREVLLGRGTKGNLG